MICFVCRGNRIRSPYAMERYRQMGHDCISAGTIAQFAGESLDDIMLQEAAKRGVYLDDYKTQKITPGHTYWCLDSWNYEHVHFPDKIFLAEIPDPYVTGNYQEAFEMIDRALGL